MMPPSEAYVAANAQIDAWVTQARRQEAAAYALQSRIESLGVERWSPRRELRVVVDHAGLLTDVEFTDTAMTMGPNGLARLLMSTVREARALLRESAVAAAVELLGPGAPMARSLSAEYQRVLGADGAPPVDPTPLTR